MLLVKVTREEAKYFEELIEKRTALVNLKRILGKVESLLYQKCLTEYETVDIECQNWWEIIVNKYHLEEHWNNGLTIDAVTGEIYTS